MARFELNAIGSNNFGGRSVSVDALFELGLMYACGREAEPDLVSAHKWFSLAAARGHIQARDYRKEISQEMSRQEIASAHRLSREWLAKH